MTGSDLSAADITGLKICGGDWSYTNLRYLTFLKDNLSGIRFSGADLTGSRFLKCDLRGCEFHESRVDGTVFEGSDLRRSGIAGTNLLGAVLKDALLDPGQCVEITERLTGATCIVEPIIL